jgi:hypothetical protein
MLCLPLAHSLVPMLLVKEPDPFLEQMFARMSPGSRFLFTPGQIDEIKKAFGARSRGSHAVDLRYSIGLFGKSYYFVFLAGRERRAIPRAPLDVTKLSHILAVGAALLAGCLLFAVLT